MEQSGRKTLARGVAVVMVLLLGAAAMSPAFSAFNATKKKVKKIAKKQATAVLRDRIDDFGDPIFTEEDEVVRFAGTANFGTTDKVIATIGPSSFTLLLTCEDTGGGVPRILLEIRTSESDSFLEAESGDSDLDFDAGEERVVADDTAANANDPELFEGDFFAASPSGLQVESDTNSIANYGADCAIAGVGFVISPL